MDTDSEWEKWGAKDPYYGVVTNPKFRRKNLTDKRKEEFFESGLAYIEKVLETCRSKLDENFRPCRALDFGCGTGRVLIPIATIADEVTGIDVSKSMLQEARDNCEQRGLTNTNLILSDDSLSKLEGEFDFIHSFIVFQHIPTERGLKILRRLLDHLATGGIAALQFTYSTQFNRIQKTLDRRTRIKRSLVRAFKKVKRQLLTKTRPQDPKMLMAPYELSQVLEIVQEAGAKSVYTEFTEHFGTYGIHLYFQIR